MVDDAFISLRYAERLVAGNGLTWTDGERVEGYTNLLWVLCNAALHALGASGRHRLLRAGPDRPGGGLVDRRNGAAAPRGAGGLGGGAGRTW